MKFITAVLFFIFATGATAATDKDTSLKSLAIHVSTAAKNIASDAAKMQFSDNSLKARLALNLRVDKLTEEAKPLGLAFDKPYGRCGTMVKNLYDFIEVAAGISKTPITYVDMYRDSERWCTSQINGDDESDKDTAILHL
ncbi:hypothetical protein [Trabulsiella odontotermitis]|uniref:hypothetical protein n=1 Tax=Trabulsiella odontotermitis TaxID=379893 RepID=UPI000676415F|nr:hypothetical protein [Trabulsiella odontotermitis]KNC89694.1 hypothetical protein GM30_06715 [Trabulsiella odontotermitis]